MDRLEALRLRQQNILLQAQSLERDILVLNYKSLIEQANQLQQEIMKIEEEVRRNENQQKMPDVNITGLHAADRDRVVG
jgi:hypothetical protein